MKQDANASADIISLISELEKIPSPAQPDLSQFEPAIQESIRYLSSEEALQSLRTNVYWPKWNSPWWHMHLLWEMGEASRIPRPAVQAIIRAQNELKVHVFPVRPEELPEGADAFADTSCHCALGSLYQILTACGVSVDDEIPWIKPWFFRYQMSDGGLNCDTDAYLQHAHEAASSMVGTIGPLEAVLSTPRALTEQEITFVDRAALCLIDRQLMRGSTSKHNAEEQEDETDWLKLCFPRFYFYDILRGLDALLKWAEVRKKPLPFSAITPALAYLAQRFPDGRIMIERRGYEGWGTRALTPEGKWIKQEEATFFPLLDQASQIGRISPSLTRQWGDIRKRAIQSASSAVYSKSQ